MLSSPKAYTGCKKFIPISRKWNSGNYLVPDSKSCLNQCPYSWKNWCRVINIILLYLPKKVYNSFICAQTHVYTCISNPSSNIHQNQIWNLILKKSKRELQPFIKLVTCIKSMDNQNFHEIKDEPNPSSKWSHFYSNLWSFKKSKNWSRFSYIKKMVKKRIPISLASFFWKRKKKTKGIGLHHIRSIY